jgi:hypothetical protein
VLQDSKSQPQTRRHALAQLARGAEAYVALGDVVANQVQPIHVRVTRMSAPRAWTLRAAPADEDLRRPPRRRWPLFGSHERALGPTATLFPPSAPAGDMLGDAGVRAATAAWYGKLVGFRDLDPLGQVAAVHRYLCRAPERAALTRLSRVLLWSPPLARLGVEPSSFGFAELAFLSLRILGVHGDRQRLALVDTGKDGDRATLLALTLDDGVWVLDPRCAGPMPQADLGGCRPLISLDQRQVYAHWRVGEAAPTVQAPVAIHAAAD